MNFEQQIGLIIAFVAVTALLVGYNMPLSSTPQEVPGLATPLPQPSDVLDLNHAATPSPASQQPLSRVSLKLPAVDKDNKGALAELVVEVSEGTGSVFYKIDSTDPVVNTETQYSVRLAFEVAKKLSGKSVADKNIYYAITADSDAVGGKSAGAACAVATLSALTGKTLDPRALITGTVEADGSIGAVGKISEKARVAKEAGFTTLIVPPGESTQFQQKTECEQETAENSFVKKCRTTSVPVLVEDEVGIKVVEAPSIAKAFEIMTARN